MTLYFYFLIVFFIILLSFQFFSMNEGFENKRSRSNVYILSQKNEANIEYLKERMNEINNVNRRINSMQENMDGLQLQIDSLVKQQVIFGKLLEENDII